jgi:hypothetical protein
MISLVVGGDCSYILHTTTMATRREMNERKEYNGNDDDEETQNGFGLR